MNGELLTGTFHGVLDRYRLREPVPPRVRRHAIASRRRQFKKTLRRTAGYSLLFALVADVYFILKRFGVSVTIVKAAAFMASMTFIAASLVASALYWFVLRPQAVEDAAGGKAPVTAADEKTAARDTVHGRPEPQAVTDDRVGVQNFGAVDASAPLGARAADRLAARLAALRGGDRVVNLRAGRGGKKSGMMLFGAVEGEGGSYAVVARVVTVKDSRIIFYDRETAAGEGDLDAACDRLADRIYSIIH